MPLQVFDRINDVNTPKLLSIDITKYFSEMKLTQEQKRERIALAEDLEDAMLFFFSLVILLNEYSYMQAISTVDAKQQLRDRVYDVVGKHTEITAEMRDFLDDFVEDVNDTTTEHLIILLALIGEPDPDPEKRESEEFYLSDDRARLLGEEEANTIFNSVDFYRAKRLGLKRKRWNTMRDKYVRKDHERVEGKIIPIDELFLVGNSYLRFPRDMKYNPSMRQIAGCRCSITYMK